MQTPTEVSPIFGKLKAGEKVTLRITRISGEKSREKILKESEWRADKNRELLPKLVVIETKNQMNSTEAAA